MKTILEVHFQEVIHPRTPIVRLRKEVPYQVFPHMMLKRDMIHDHVWEVTLGKDDIYLAKIQNIITPSGQQSNGNLFNEMIADGWYEFIPWKDTNQ